MGSGFDVSSSSGPLGSFLNQTASSGLLGALGGTTAASTTAMALKTGGLTNSEHNAIVSIASGGTSGDAIGWNKDGSEPTTLQNLRTNGWAKLVKKTTVDGQTTGVYTLTAIGKAIYARTGGGLVGTDGDGADGVTDAEREQVTNALNAVSGIMSSLGLSSGSGTSSSGISTGVTGQNASNVLSGSSSTSPTSVDMLA